MNIELFYKKDKILMTVRKRSEKFRSFLRKSSLSETIVAEMN